MRRLAACLVLLTSVAWAAPTVTPQGVVYSSPESADGTLRSFSGTVTPFGPVTGNLQLYVSGYTFTGQFFQQSSGGTAYGTIDGYFTSLYTYAERLTYAGGTGRYVGISGYADVTGALNPDGTATDRVVGGQIHLP